MKQPLCRLLFENHVSSSSAIGSSSALPGLWLRPGRGIHVLHWGSSTFLFEKTVGLLYGDGGNDIALSLYPKRAGNIRAEGRVRRLGEDCVQSKGDRAKEKPQLLNRVGAEGV